MAKYYTTDTELTSIANAIREKGGTSASLTYPSGFVSAIQNIPTGTGKGSTDGDVVFIDYDGTVIDAKTKTQINAMTSNSDLPANPSHAGLTAQGWNWTVAQLKAQLTAMPNQKIYVGQMYVTESGATEIDVVMQEGRLNPTLTICVDGTVNVDWGDDTIPDSITGTSLTTRIAQAHTYASAGSYTIKISKTSGTGYAFSGTSSYTLLRKNGTGNENRTYSNTIKNVRIGNDIKISAYAFNSCASLATITISSGVTSIGDSAFQSCYSLATIIIPSSIISIGDGAFSGCASLTNIMMPSSMTSINARAFNSCYSLTSIMIPSGVTSIGSNAFNSCYSLARIIIPNTVTSIGDKAFQYCYSLAKITIPNSVTSIGVSVFYSCYSLVNITISSNITSIGASAFYSCYSLATIIIPSDVTSIGDNAFYSCYSLAKITIPSGVTSIGGNAFQSCCGVSEYHVLPTTTPTLGTTGFKNIVSDCIIYVPKGKLNDYQTASNWSDYASYMQEEPS